MCHPSQAMESPQKISCEACRYWTLNEVTEKALCSVMPYLLKPKGILTHDAQHVPMHIEMLSHKTRWMPTLQIGHLQNLSYLIKDGIDEGLFSGLLDAHGDQQPTSGLW